MRLGNLRLGLDARRLGPVRPCPGAIDDNVSRKFNKDLRCFHLLKTNVDRNLIIVTGCIEDAPGKIIEGNGVPSTRRIMKTQQMLVPGSRGPGDGMIILLRGRELDLGMMDGRRIKPFTDLRRPHESQGGVLECRGKAFLQEWHIMEHVEDRPDDTMRCSTVTTSGRLSVFEPRQPSVASHGWTVIVIRTKGDDQLRR